MKRVMKRNNRSKTIWEFRDEGIFLNIEFPAVPSCRVLEQSMVLCLLVLLGTMCFEILAITGECCFFGDILIFGTSQREKFLIFIYHDAKYICC